MQRCFFIGVDFQEWLWSFQKWSTKVKDGMCARACKLLIQDVNATNVPKFTLTPSCNIGPNSVDADSGDEEPIVEAAVRKRQRRSAHSRQRYQPSHKTSTVTVVTAASPHHSQRNLRRRPQVSPRPSKINVHAMLIAAAAAAQRLRSKFHEYSKARRSHENDTHQTGRTAYGFLALCTA